MKWAFVLVLLLAACNSSRRVERIGVYYDTTVYKYIGVYDTTVYKYIEVRAGGQHCSIKQAVVDTLRFSVGDTVRCMWSSY